LANIKEAVHRGGDGIVIPLLILVPILGTFCVLLTLRLAAKFINETKERQKQAAMDRAAERAAMVAEIKLRAAEKKAARARAAAVQAELDAKAQRKKADRPPAAQKGAAGQKAKGNEDTAGGRRSVKWEDISSDGGASSRGRSSRKGAGKGRGREQQRIRTDMAASDDDDDDSAV
jgi:hypothetical protein